MKLQKIQNQAGQAVIEYIVIFSLMAFIAIKMAGSLQGFAKTTMGGLAKALTKELGSGVCEKNCFFKSYSNGI